MREPIKPRLEEIKHKNFNKSNLFNKQLISSEAIEEILETPIIIEVPQRHKWDEHPMMVPGEGLDSLY